MIYTIGSIAVSGNTLTGTGTNFKAPLSMIRVGCTVIVKSDPIQIFSITEIVSETELSVTPAAAPDIPVGTDYSILLCDSISVDGLAQDVAEALRYFTGQESEIYAAVEYWKNYGDAAQVEALLTAIQAETAQSTANAAATAADVETTAAARDEAIAAKDAAEGYSVLAGEQAATATTQATTATEQATAAALSEANAKTYAKQAKALSEDSLSVIGLGADHRDWPDCTVDPSAYIGFVRLEEATATGFPSIASGEVYLVGWLARGDGAIINGCFVGTNTRSLYTYHFNNADGTYGWTRHARKNEVSRFNQSGSDRTVVYSMDDPTTGCYLQLDATGRWGYYSPVDNCWKALAIAQGGTGATDATTARTNLAAMHEQKSSLGDTDLDTLTAAYSGFYWQGASSKATTGLHYPCNYGGALIVLKNGNHTNGATQLYYPYNSTGLYYMRTYCADHETWTDWAKFESDPLIHEEAPFPDVWIPFNDSLDMLAGFAPGYKKVTVNGETTSIPSDKVVTFARASTATYINKSGALTIADIDEPRFEREGLLIEGTRTNYMLNSDDPDRWGRSVDLTVTESGVDSFGFTYGKFSCNDSLIGQTTPLNMAVIVAARSVDVSGDNKYVTTSCRFKTDLDLRLRIRFDMYDGSTTVYQGDAYINAQTLKIQKTGGAKDRITVTAKKDEVSGWIFAEATFTAVDGDLQIGSQIQYAPPLGGATVQGDYIYLATPQVEDGSCATSFIPSGRSATTRASDMVSIPAANNLFNPPLSFLLEVHKEWSVGPNNYPCIWDGIDASSGRSMIAAISSNNGKPYFGISKATASSSINSYTSAALDEISTFGAVVRADNTGHTIMNGEIGAEVTYEYLEIIAGSTIRIGGGSTTGDRHLFGHIRNFRIWHKALTDGQLFEKV